MDNDVVALCDVLREIDEGRVVSPTWLHARYPKGGGAAAEALFLETLVASSTEVPARVGPFRVLRELGRGGMGVVYLADRDPASSASRQRVAVKVLHARLAAHPEAVQAILREAALGRQVRHPNVVPVLDAGTCVVGGRPSVYLAMEYMDGAPLSSRLRAGGVPEPLCLRVARDVTRGLMALHEQGIVHRDVKPSNVLVATSRRILLADLGVAMLRSEIACVTDRPAFVGTLPYAAPEQVAGAEIDARADLFALGVTLSELATGVASSAPAGLRGQGYSRFFEELVRKLLSPRREARFDSAAALLEALVQRERSRWWTRRMAAIRARGGPAAARRRRGPRIHARGEELARLRAAVDAAQGGEGRAVLVVGEAGIGKSRLLDELLGEAARRDDAFRLWRCAFRPLRDPRGALALERSARALIEAAGSATADFRLSGASTYVALAEALTVDFPLVAVFEDLHFASGDERTAVAALAAAAPRRSLLVVASTREPVPLAWDGERLVLPRLPADATEALVRDALGSQASPVAVARAAARSRGNPLFALALARADREGNRSARTTLPAAIRRLVSARLSRLGAEERDLLGMAACLGEEIDVGVVARALGIAAPEAARRLARIAAGHGLLRQHAGRFAFEHQLVLEALVREVPARRRRELCAALADALEAIAGRPPEGDAAVALCRLYLDGGRDEDALRHVDRALDVLAAGQAHAAAAELCGRVLGIKGLLRGAPRLDILLRSAAHAHALGRDGDAASLLDEALCDAAKRGDVAARARVLLQSAERLVATGRYEQALAALAEAGDREPGADLVAGRALLTLGRPEEACARLERANQRGREAGDAGLEARATVVLGDLHVSRARLADARRCYETALPLLRSAGDADGEAQALQGLATALYSVGDYARAESVAREQLALHRRTGNRRGEARACNRVASCLLVLGDIAGARWQYERAHALAIETGDLDSEAILTGSLGYVRFVEGHLADSLAWCERSIALFERVGKPQGHAIGLYSSGMMYTCLGMAATARQRLEASLALTRRHGLRLGEASALAALADAQALESAGDDVLARYEEALAVRREAGPDASASDHLLAVGRLLLRRGEVERARPYIEQAFATASGAEGALQAAAYRAQLPGSDVRGAVDRVLALEPRAPVQCRMTGRFLLWKATGEIGHLAESYRLLLHLRAHAPPEARESILAGVPLHRELVAAWTGGARR